MIRLTRIRPSRRRCNALRLKLDVLEERTLLATIQVTTTSDRPFEADGVLTLRDAIELTDGLLTVGQLSAAQQALVAGTPDQSGVPDTIDFDIPFDDPGHLYYKDNGTSGSVSLADVADVPAVAIDGVTPIMSDAQLADPNLVGAGNTIDPDWTHSWWSIQPTSPLPAITNPVTIDGWSQGGSGYTGSPLIELDGSLGAAYGLYLNAANCTVQGLAINRFVTPYITGAYAIYSVGANAAIQGCYLGSDASGTQALPNTNGLFVSGENSLVGSSGDDSVDDASERNLISGNSEVGVTAVGDGIVIAGNYIGTDVSGESRLGNNIGVQITGPSWLGFDGTAACPEDQRNIISGNADFGVQAWSGAIVAGNYIGTDAEGVWSFGGDGLAVLANALGNGWGDIGSGEAGIDVNDDVLVGTSADGVDDQYERNVISGNLGVNVDFLGANSVVAGNYIGPNADGTWTAQSSSFWPIGVAFESGSHDNVLGTDGMHGIYDADERNIISGNNINCTFRD
jgi:hypothetical protein